MKPLIQAILRALYRFKTRFFPRFRLDRFPALQGLVNRLTLRSRGNYVENVLGHRMYLDDRDSLQLSTRGVYEPFETRFLQQSVRPGMLVLDVGANIGYYTLQFARAVGPTGRVYAFEPDPANFALLRRNIEANGYEAIVTPVNRAVSDRPGVLNLYVSEDNRGDHRTYGADDGRAAIPVEAVALDDFLRDLDRPVDLVKMDIQGAEYYALKGMTGLLQRSPDVTLVMEFWPFGLRGSGAEPRAVLELLRGLGFSFRELSEHRRAIAPVELDDLLRAYPADDEGAFTNLICRRGVQSPK